MTFAELEKILLSLVSEKSIESQREAYVAFSQGRVSLMPIQTLGQLPFLPLMGGPLAQVQLGGPLAQGAAGRAAAPRR